MTQTKQRYSRRHERSADYDDPEPESAQSGVTDRNIPKSGSRKAAIAVGVLVAVVVALLVSRMPFLAGSLNAGAPVGEIAEESVSPIKDGGLDTAVGAAERDPAREDVTDLIGEDGGASSSLPTPNRVTPSTVPAAD